MVITQDHVVSVHYTLTADDGSVIDSSRDHGPLEYIHGHHMMIPGFEKALEGAATGQEVSFSVEPEEGYGMPNDEEIFDVDRAEFDPTDDLQIGGQVHGTTEDGQSRAFKIVNLTDDAVSLDGNHPLAGAVLHFDVEILSVRKATPQEIEHKHVHEAGHDH